MPLYSPYGSLQELLDAAGVPVGEMYRYNTEALQEMAAQRARAAAATTVETAQRVEEEKVAWATRSIRIPYGLEKKVDAKARKAGTNLNAVVTRLLQEYASGER